jgi:Family of unknown function (DUF5681)
MPRDPDHPSYDVGYKRPPMDGRFKRGQSGNPKGRPKGKRAVESAIDKVLSQTVKMKVDGRQKRVPVPEAVLMRLVQQALTGNPRAGLDVLKLVRASEDARPEPAESPPESEREQKEWVAVVTDWGMIIEGLVALGLCERNEHGRPKLVPELLELGLERRPDQRDNSAVAMLRDHLIVGAPDI